MSNLTSSRQKAYLKVRSSLQSLRDTLRLDRRSSLRLRSLHPVRFQVSKIKDHRLASRSLRLARANGNSLVTNARLLFHKLTHQHAMARKYRLKLDAISQEFLPLSAVPFKIRPTYLVFRARRLVAKRVGNSLRQRTLTSTRLYSRLYALRLRSVQAPCVPAEAPYRYRRMWHKRWTKRYQERNRRRPYARAGWLVNYSKAVLPNNSLRRLLAEQYRAIRVDFRGYTVSHQRRWWRNKRLRRLERRAKKPTKTNRSCVSVKVVKKQSRWLHRRRFRGKRLFAGMMGPRRWRAERRDKFFVRRERRQEPVRRNMVYTSTGVTKINNLQSRQQLHKLRTLFSSKVFGPWRRSVIPAAQSVQLLRRKTSLKKALVLSGREKQKKLTCTLFKRTSAKAQGKQQVTLPAARVGCVPRVTASVKARRPRRLVARRSQSTLRVPLRGRGVSQLRKALIQRQLTSATLAALTRSATPVLLKAERPFGQAQKRNQINLFFAQFVRNKFFGMSTVKGGATEIKAADKLEQLLSSLPQRGFTVGNHTNNSPTFLQQPQAQLTLRPRRLNFISFAATLMLARERRRYSEQRFYRKRSLMRLPRTAVTRRRRRKGGLVTFVRNSLKRPQTSLGQQHLLLPPIGVHAMTKTVYASGVGPASHKGLSLTAKREDSWPLFWRRPHNRANIKAISAVRRRQYSRRKRRYILRQKRWVAHIHAELPTGPSLPNKPLFSTSKGVSLLEQKSRIQGRVSEQQFARLTCALTTNRAYNVARFLTRKRRKKSMLTYSARRSLLAVRRTAHRLTPAMSRVLERSLLTMSQTEVKSLGLWQARSVQNMLVEERATSAWSPQLSVRNRRAHYPRVRGVPVRRRVLSFTAKRARRNFNAKLLARNIPQRRYTDYTAIKLQYYYGSVGSAGYVRFRRVHRPHSKHNRWWRPNKFAAPFAHPFSRRALNAKRYLRSDVSVAQAPGGKGFTHLMRDTRAVFLHSKFPSRPIPWRNFRYKRPRWGRTPKTLQRWTFVKRNGKTGCVRPALSRLVLKRTPRELRELERYVFNRNVWKARRWNLVDNTALRSAVEASLFVALRAVPHTVWTALQQRAGSAAAYTVLQRHILDEFRRWGRKEQKTSHQAAPTMTMRAQLFLINLLSSILRLSSKAAGQVVHDAQRHFILRSTSFSKKVQLKAFNFLRLRTLPQLDRAPNAESILQRERSGLYRRWLQGVEGAVKRTQLGYAPTNRSRYTANVATAFGRRRGRFPASGRRHKSYDSLLHAFAKKIAPARFRRAAVLQFKRALPRIAFDFRENLLTAGNYAGLNRRTTFAHRLSSAGYLSAPWREVLQYRAAADRSIVALVNGVHGAKRRFLALPLAAEATKQAKRALQAVSPYKQQMRVIRAGILRRALRRRREERPFIDLRHAVLQRRLPKEQATNPWKLRRAVRRWRAAKMGPYSSFTVQRRAAIAGRWTLVHLSAVGPQHEYLELSPLPSILSSGERIAPMNTVLRKDKRAFRGFVLPVNTPKRKKLRRLIRGVTSRSRVSRRPNPAGRRAVLRNMSHWSEKRDQDFRTATLRHKRVSYAKRASRSLEGKIGPRHAATLFGARCNKKIRRSRLVHFMNSKHNNKFLEKQKQLRNSPTANTLVQNSSLRSKKRLISTSQTRLTRIRQRSYRAPRRQHRKAQSARARSNFRITRENPSVSDQLLVSVGSEEPTISLWFQKPAARIVKSEKAKENDALADIAQKEGRYKITAQYVESLTAFLPELMNHLLSKKIEKESQQVRYTTAQHLVRNIYWSLRVYLNVDPFDIRFFARDKTPAARVRLFEQISDMSEFQVTDQPQRAVLRYRFQPSKVLRAPNTMRFRGDWLRAFFPAKHALYQENPEDYRKFLFKTRRIRSLRIGPRGMESWITEKQRIGHETRARQILTLRFSRKRRRFETVLQTTRRIPVPENVSAAVDGRPRNHFFNRQFSTYAGRSLAVTARWFHRQKRFIALEQGWRIVAPVVQVAARSRSVRHLESRSRTNYISTGWAALSNSFLDTRFTRAKSSRSRQYLIRMLRALWMLTKNKKFANLIFYTKQLERKLKAVIPTKVRWTRSSRRAAAVSLRSGWASHNRTDLQAVRATYPTLRAGTLRTTLRVYSAKKLRRSQLRTSTVTHKAPVILPKEAVFSLPPLYRLLKRDKKWKLLARKKRSVARLPNLENKVFLARKLLEHSRFGAKSLKPRRAFRQSRQGRVRFFKRGLSQGIFRSLDFARACALYTKFNRQAPFEAHRPKLWDALTQRWMKKHRIGRYWLRDTSRWLRDPWLSQIVACDAALRPDRFGGELRSRAQQVGEYVADVDAEGRDIKRKNAPRERHKFQKVLPIVVDPEIKKTNKILRKGSRLDRSLARQRLRISRQAARKPMPGIRLANYEFRDVLREHKENKSKSMKQRKEEEELRVKVFWARKAKKLPPLRPKRLPLKHPANLWLPHVIWKEIQRRIRKFEWRESDEVFFRRGFRRAFQFHSNERRKAPWLEKLMYTRAAYSTRLSEFRRRQYPHEQKKFKWLQRVRRMLYPGRNAWYIKGRRWPQLRRYNQKLHYSLFNFRDRGAARRHFKKSAGHTRPSISAFVSMCTGLTDRLDIICLQLGFAPSIYWARIVAEFGLLRVNGKTVYDPAYRLKPDDVIYPKWDTVARFQHYFRPYLRTREEYLRRNRASTTLHPTNMEYHRGIRAFIYRHAPEEFDLRKSGRIFAPYLRWFGLDSV